MKNLKIICFEGWEVYPNAWRHANDGHSSRGVTRPSHGELGLRWDWPIRCKYSPMSGPKNVIFYRQKFYQKVFRPFMLHMFFGYASETKTDIYRLTVYSHDGFSCW